MDYNSLKDHLVDKHLVAKGVDNVELRIVSISERLDGRIKLDLSDGTAATFTADQIEWLVNGKKVEPIEGYTNEVRYIKEYYNDGPDETAQPGHHAGTYVTDGAGTILHIEKINDDGSFDGRIVSVQGEHIKHGQIKEGMIPDKWELVDYTEPSIAEVPEEVIQQTEISEPVVEETEISEPVVEETKINQPEYKYYLLNTNNKIIEGFEYKEDARERNKEHAENGYNYRVVSKRDMPVSPDVNEHWDIGLSDAVKDCIVRAKDWSIKMAHEKRDSFSGKLQHDIGTRAGEWMEILKYSFSKFFHGEDINKNDKYVLLNTVSGYRNYILHKIEACRKYNMPFDKQLMDEYHLISEAENILG